MSGYSESRDCPRCGTPESLEASVDSEDVQGMCLECGYEYHTVSTVLDLETVNEERVEIEQEPLTELKPPYKEWRNPDEELKLVKLLNIEELKKWIEESCGHLNPEIRPFLLMGIEALYVKLGGEKFIKFV